MKTFLHVLQALMTLGAIIVGPFTPLYLLSLVPATSSESKAAQATLQEKVVERSKVGTIVEKKEAESALPPFVQKQHDWFLTENMDSGQWGREFGLGTGCYGICKGATIGQPHFLWYAWSNSDGLITLVLNIVLTKEHAESIEKIQYPGGHWITRGATSVADAVTHDTFGTEAKTWIETDNTWVEKFCTLEEGEAWSCNERAALEAILKRLEELPFFDSMVLGIRMFPKKN